MNNVTQKLPRAYRILHSALHLQTPASREVEDGFPAAVREGGDQVADIVLRLFEEKTGVSAVKRTEWRLTHSVPSSAHCWSPR